MDLSVAIGICAGAILVALLAAATTEIVSEVEELPGRLLKAAVKLQKGMLHAIERKPWPRRRNESMSASEEMIRQRAYELWDQAGRPNGRSDEFWFSAKAEFEPKVRTRGHRARLYAGVWSRVVMKQPPIG